MKINYKIKPRKLAEEFAKGFIQVECHNHENAEKLILLINKLYGYRTANNNLSWKMNTDHTRLACLQEARENDLDIIISSSEKSGHRQYYKDLPIVDVDKLLNEE